MLKIQIIGVATTLIFLKLVESQCADYNACYCCVCCSVGAICSVYPGCEAPAGCAVCSIPACVGCNSAFSCGDCSTCGIPTYCTESSTTSSATQGGTSSQSQSSSTTTTTASCDVSLSKRTKTCKQVEKDCNDECKALVQNCKPYVCETNSCCADYGDKGFIALRQECEDTTVKKDIKSFCKSQDDECKDGCKEDFIECNPNC